MDDCISSTQVQLSSEKLSLQVAGIVDAMFHNAIRMVKKMELGKQFWYIKRRHLTIHIDPFATSRFQKEYSVLLLWFTYTSVCQKIQWQ